MPEDLIRSYDGMLWKADLDSATRHLIEEAASASGLKVDLGPGYIEFQFVGRDRNRFVVRFLKVIAELILQADGEIQCVCEREGEDPLFEFFTISDGRLWVQKGRLVRASERSEVH